MLIAGPPGSGKTYLAKESGLPLLDLDDFYKDGDDATLPRHPTLGIDWDHPASWDMPAAMAALETICRDGAFLRRLRRDLAEHRDPPLTLVRRGLTQLRAEPSVLARQMSLGCRPCDRAGTLAALRAAAQAGRPDNRPAR